MTSIRPPICANCVNMCSSAPKGGARARSQRSHCQRHLMRTVLLQVSASDNNNKSHCYSLSLCLSPSYILSLCLSVSLAIAVKSKQQLEAAKVKAV